MINKPPVGSEYNMTYETQFLLPRLGEGDGGGRIISWLKRSGESFEQDETILEVETDKAVIEVPAPQSGVLIELLAQVDDLVDFQDPVATVRFEGSAPKDVSDSKGTTVDGGNGAWEALPIARSVMLDPSKSPARIAAGTSGERLLSTPNARRLARETGVDLSSVTATGKGGRIVGADVDRQARGVRSIPGRVTRATGFDIDERFIGVEGRALFVKSWIPSQRRARATALMVHGLFADVDAWSANASVLARQGIAVTALDLPCHGRSSGDMVDFDDGVEQVLRIVHSLSSEPLVLIGHSFGAALAARVARRLNNQPTGLLMIAPAGLGTRIDQSFLDGMIHAQSLESLERELRKLTARSMPVGREYIALLMQRMQSRKLALERVGHSVSVAGTQQIDIVPDLEALTVPMRIIHGVRDVIIPYKHALNAPPRVALHLVADAGHMPQWEASGLTTEIVATLCGV